MFRFNCAFPKKQLRRASKGYLPNYECSFSYSLQASWSKSFTKILSEQKIYFTVENVTTSKKVTFFTSNSLFVSFKFGR